MCGIIGITAANSVVQDIYDGLMVLQHRGQDSAGIMTYNGFFHLKKGNGLVRDVFDVKNMVRLKGNMGIGHVRYPTAGTYEASEAQPFYVSSPYGISLIHNGNLTNYEALKKYLEKQAGRYLNTNSDSEALLGIVADAVFQQKKKTMKPEDFFRAMKKVYGRIKGSYAVIGMIAGHGLYAFRDPNGIRPLVFGQRKVKGITEFMFASESVAQDTLGFQILGDVQPGEAVFIDLKSKVHRKQVVPSKWAPCIFEFVYLARPDSVMDNISVYKARLRMGEYLARQIKKAKLPIDVVIPVPDSARTSALTIAQSLGVRYREGLVKNRYIGRTFIMPGQAIRKRSIHYKLNTIPFEIRRKNVLLVDDSIVRGNTSRRIVEMVRQAGAKKVFFASSAPPLRSPCVYGVDMPSRKDFVAHRLKIDGIRKSIGADALFYQTLPDLVKAVKHGKSHVTNFCTACFSGKYPTPEITEKVLRKAEQNRGTIDPGENGLHGEPKAQPMLL